MGPTVPLRNVFIASSVNHKELFRWLLSNNPSEINAPISIYANTITDLHLPSDNFTANRLQALLNLSDIDMLPPGPLSFPGRLLKLAWWLGDGRHFLGGLKAT